MTVELEVADPAVAMERLHAAGLSVLPAGHRLRVPGGYPATVEWILSDCPLRLHSRPASLEEAFVALSSVPGGP